MPQVHTYLPEALVEKVRQRARAQGLSLSRYLAELISREIGDEWPERFFEEVLGGWKGELERPPQGDLEHRESL